MYVVEDCFAITPDNRCPKTKVSILNYIARLSPAHMQGLTRNVEHYSNTSSKPLVGTLGFIACLLA